MSLWHPMRLRWTVKLSELEIDTNKDWRGYVIKNLGKPTDPYDSARKIDLDTLTIPWDRVTNKPSTFPPSAHTHYRSGASNNYYYSAYIYIIEQSSPTRIEDQTSRWGYAYIVNLYDYSGTQMHMHQDMNMALVRNLDYLAIRGTTKRQNQNIASVDKPI